LDIERYLQLRHIIVSSRRSGPAVEDFELGRLGYHRNIGMRCQNYFVAWKTIAESDMLLTVPENYARQTQSSHKLTIWPMPVELRPMASYVYWHTSFDADPANIWLRKEIVKLHHKMSVTRH